MVKKKSFLEKAQQSIADPQALTDDATASAGATRGEYEGTTRIKEARNIPIERIKPDPDQPRTVFDEESLKELADSIRENGIQQPITVEYIELEDYFKIISGERRYRASQLAKLTHIPCVVRADVDPKKRLALQLIENIQREDLSPIDKARGLLEYKRSLGPKAQWKEVEEITGISERRRQQFLALLDLPEDIQSEIVALGSDRTAKNVITEFHARALLKLKKHPEKQKELFSKIKASPESLSGKDAIKLAKEMIQPTEQPREKLTFVYSSVPDLIAQLKAKLKELELAQKK